MICERCNKSQLHATDRKIFVQEQIGWYHVPAKNFVLSFCFCERNIEIYRQPLEMVGDGLMRERESQKMVGRTYTMYITA